MKKYLPCFFICILVIACSDKKEEVQPVQREKIQSITVTKKINLTKSDQGSFYYPRFSPDGSKVFFTSSNYRGLSYYDLKSNKIVFLNNLPGSGFDLCFSSDNSAVFFKSDTIQNRRRYYNIFWQNLKSHEMYKLNERTMQKVTGLVQNGEDELLFWVDRQLMSFDPNSQELVTAMTNTPQYSIQGDKLVIAQNNDLASYTPFPDQNLIWIEPVPLSSNILIYVVGHGLFNFNPMDSSSNLIGDFRAARCSPDGRLLVYMRDQDDGHRVTGSDIFVATLADKRSFVITDTADEIEMYPQWAPDGRHLVYHTESGMIKLVSIEIN